MGDVVTNKPQTILEIADGFVHGDRAEDYGHPYWDFSRTAKAWNAMFGWQVEPEQVALAMILVKLSRLTNDPTKRDSIIDIGGYAETYDMVMQYKKAEVDPSELF